ncbi:MAG: pyrroline-5-carboxylate reductase [Desulfatibacillaceae bacterium]|nr:pyrroline-5-carboxylate reductase [Desulfatibacillaceae bacterium]
MDLRSKKIGFIGAGNMARAIMGALVESKTLHFQNILVSDAQKEALDQVRDIWAIASAPNNAELFNQCDVIVLAVKPQVMPQVLEELAEKALREDGRRRLVVSVAAGVSIAAITKILHRGLKEDAVANLPVVRVMPNTPALVGSGMSAIAGGALAKDDDLEFVQALLRPCGMVLIVDEKEMDAVTAVSGSGPAYVFFLAEVMMEAALSLNLSPEKAKTLVLATVEGAARLLNEGDKTPEQLRRQVTSPGGTTQAAMEVLEARGVRQAFVEAIRAASNRSMELGK